MKYLAIQREPAGGARILPPNNTPRNTPSFLHRIVTLLVVMDRKVKRYFANDHCCWRKRFSTRMKPSYKYDWTYLALAPRNREDQPQYCPNDCPRHAEQLAKCVVAS